ncbi:MAG: hypothetical protein P4M11_09360 [Candidatus Pacebacteria bacterium]|nr:hypothetical protein [Candidatus Paceibacterota bacterium]
MKPLPYSPRLLLAPARKSKPLYLPRSHTCSPMKEEAAQLLALENRPPPPQMRGHVSLQLRHYLRELCGRSESQCSFQPFCLERDRMNRLLSVDRHKHVFALFSQRYS